ncbi:MAG: hypothetical protein AB1679_18130 [Actinomycetota bacterium]|jgi:predicted RNA-binding protein YlqC (UPF0109 family)
MSMSRIAHRRRRVGAALVGLCIAAGSVGTAALADSGSGSGTTITVEASVMVKAGMTPLNAHQAAASLNSAIDSAAHGIARSATGAIPAGRPVGTTVAASKAFANQVDAALTEFVVQSVGGLRAAGVATHNLVHGTMAALNAVLRTIPGAVAVSTGAEVSVATGADGTRVSASLNPVVETALRQTIGDSVRAIRPVLPLTRTTVRAVAAGVRQVVDASAVAVDKILAATVDFTGAVLGVTGTTLQAVRTVVDSAVAGLRTIVAAVDATLDNLSDVNLTAAVDASLRVSAR